MTHTHSTIARLVHLLAAALVIAASAEAGQVIIRTSKPYAPLVNEIVRSGGTVTYQFKYVNAIAADVPDALLDRITARLPAGAVTKDKLVNLPASPRDRNGHDLLLEADTESVGGLASAALAQATGANPDNYLINDANMNLFPLFTAGKLGQGMKVAVIDSGYRPGFPALTSDGSVIGGEDLVGDALGWSHFANGGHGTFVATMISGNVVFGFSPASSLLAAVRRYCPDCVVDANGDGAANEIPLLGSAPSASIYAVRVFPPTGGAPESRIIAAMERVIQLRENFDSGMPETRNANGSYSALNVKVCNMSLGGGTTYAGRDLEDQLTQVMLDKDIVLVTSAGNAGPSGTTIGSPGTGFGSLTVGASSSPVHERILRELQFGAGIGELYRPFNAPQMAYFSSRGPSADGRPDIEVVANGFASFGQGFASSPSGISIGSGTSFSAPSVAGIAAVLRQVTPGATARQVRNAIIETANPGFLQDGSGVLDQGAGYVNAAAAAARLQAGLASDAPGNAGGVNVNVNVNLLQGAGIKTYDGNVTETASGLKPGQRHEIYYRVHKNTAAVVIHLANFKAGPTQNPLFGEDILLTVHSAKTSAIGEGDYSVFAFTTGGTFVVQQPEEGLMRITLNGDWTNAGEVGATVQVFSVADSEPGQTALGKIANGQLVVLPFTVPTGASLLEVKLAWDGDWSSYPLNDLDLILVDPSGAPNFDGASLNCPERVALGTPAAGQWFALVDGFTVNTKNGDKYQLRISVDGVVLK